MNERGSGARRSWRRLAAGLGCAGLAVTLCACSGGQPDASASGPGSLPPASGTSAPSEDPSTGPGADPSTAGTSPSPGPSGPTEPLTGRPAASEKVADRPVVAVDVALGATRPRGLANADVVFEETGSPSTTRLIALYQSRDAAAVGPVGPTRPADGKVLSFFQPVLAHSGGPKGFLAVLGLFPVTTVTPGKAPAAFRRTGGGLTVATADLRKRAPSGVAAPAGAFAFTRPGLSSTPDAFTAARRLTVRLAGTTVASWRYDPASHRWTSETGVPAAVTNLVVQRVPFKSVRVHHPDGPLVPSAKPYGRGSAVVAIGPQAARGSWYKPGPTALTNYADPDGLPLRLRPGRTWVLLVPGSARITLSRR